MRVGFTVALFTGRTRSWFRRRGIQPSQLVDLSVQRRVPAVRSIALDGIPTSKPRMQSPSEAERPSARTEGPSGRRSKRARAPRSRSKSEKDSSASKSVKTYAEPDQPRKRSLEQASAEASLPARKETEDNSAKKGGRKPRKEKLEALTELAKERLREEQRKRLEVQQMEREQRERAAAAQREGQSDDVLRERGRSSKYDGPVETDDDNDEDDDDEAMQLGERSLTLDAMAEPSLATDDSVNASSSSSSSSSAGERQNRDSLFDYLDEIRRYQLIEHEEEVALAREVQHLNRIEEKRQDLEKMLHRPPTSQEWARALNMKSAAELQEALARGHQARNRLVTSNLRLVNAIVNRFSRRAEAIGVTMSDLMQEGSIGLIRAAERFDGSRGYRFSTFASWWIRASIFRTLDEASRIIRLPSRVTDAYQRLRKLRRLLTAELGREPTEDELAERAGMAPDKVRFVFEQVNRQVLSFDRGMDTTEDPDPDSGSFLESIADPRDEEDLVDSFMKDAVLRLLRSVLNDREVFVLRLRFGLDDDEPKTLQQVAAILNVSKERVRQISFAALAKLRKSQSAERLRNEFAEYF